MTFMPKGEATREHILGAALKLFRKRGFERTTMRDIARAAELSLGAAYHYFPSKEALVQAYYEWMQREHEELARGTVLPGADLRTRISILLQTKLSLLRRDRKVLAALFGNLGDANHPLSLFGKKTATIRQRSVAQFLEIFDDQGISDDLRPLLGRGLWLAHLGVFLFFIHDDSEDQIRTQKLADVVADLVASAVPLLSHPLAAPIRTRLLEVLGLEECS